MKNQSYKIQIKTKTGLHIGSGNDSVQIGGVDSTVMKDPRTKMPYIPGSSLKGKIRCLLETMVNPYLGKGEDDDKLNLFFGAKTEYLKKKGEDKENFKFPTRLIFRDVFLSKDDAESYKSNKIVNEIKAEIVIDRKKGSAKPGGLRTIERVPPGVTFEGEILIRYNDDNELKEIKSVLDEGIKLLNNDCLGGSGSRGYGAVEVVLI